jgi:hypothetical protein
MLPNGHASRKKSYSLLLWLQKGLNLLLLLLHQLLLQLQLK